MKVTKPGIYKDKQGREVPVVDVGFPDNPYFRACLGGSYYSVNDEQCPEEEKEYEDYYKKELEVIEFIRDFVESDFPLPRLPQ